MYPAEKGYTKEGKGMDKQMETAVCFEAHGFEVTLAKIISLGLRMSDCRVNVREQASGLMQRRYRQTPGIPLNNPNNTPKISPYTPPFRGFRL